MLFGFRISILLLTIGAFTAWGFALRWALKQPKNQWYHVWVLSLLTLFWYLGESIAIRLGKYKYDHFPLAFNFPGGGQPGHPGFLEEKLYSLLPANTTLPWQLDPLKCTADNWNIPLPVVALEAALLFGLFRLATCLLHSGKEFNIRAPLATAGLSAVLLVNVTAVLDPVVSTPVWCQPGQADPNRYYLPFALWTWYTTEPHPGYWFGVPLVNYVAWFMSAAFFTFVARLDDERPGGVIKKYKVVLLYLLATVVITALTFTALIFFKIQFDRVFIHGRELWSLESIVSQRAWQFGWVVLLLLIGGWLWYRGQRRADPQLEWISIVSKGVVFLFCLGLLLREPRLLIFAVWLLAAVIAAVVLSWPYIESALSRRRSRPISAGPTPVDPGRIVT